LRTHLDLFSGIGGFALAAQANGLETIAFCEIDPFAQKVLKKNFPSTTIHNDITNTEEFKQYEGNIDILTGGFPCQPFSVAGKQKGTQDHRDLWPEMFHIIQQTQPTWIIGENVAHFTSMAFTRTKTDLENQSYTVQPFVIPACAVQAPHRRDRIWIVAHANSKRCRTRCSHRKERPVLHDENGNAEKDQRPRKLRKCGTGKACKITPNHGSKRIQRSKPQTLCGQQAFSWCEDVRRVEDFFNRPNLPKPLIRGGSDSHRVDRTRSLGNAIVPQVAMELIKAILAVDGGACGR